MEAGDTWHFLKKRNDSRACRAGSKELEWRRGGLRGGRGSGADGDSQGQLHVLYGAAAAVLRFLAILPLDSCLVGEV